MHFEHYSPSGILGYDGAPAGTQPLSRGTGVGNLPPSNFSLSIPVLLLLRVSANFDGLQIQPDFSFVPTVSALDEDNITATSLYAPHVGAFYVPPANGTLLQNYIAQEQQTISGINVFNLQHTDFTSRNSHWMFNEMEGITQTSDCNDYCGPDGITINGSNICTSSLYTLNGLAPNSTVIWSASPSGMVQFSCTTCQQTTISAIGNGIVTITANITSSCGNATVTKQNIIIGTGIPDPLFEQKSVLCPSGNNQYMIAARITNVPGALYYNWYIDGVLKTTSSGNSASVPGGNADGRTHTLQARVQTPCGQTSTALPEGRFTARCGSGGGNLRISVSPNPTNDNITVQLIDENGKLSTDDNKNFNELQIADKMGVVLKRFNYKTGTKKVIINLAGLHSDVYLVRVGDGNEWTSVQIIKK